MIDVLAQAISPDLSGWVQVFVNLGVAGYMIYWFSTRMERLLESMRRALDRNNRARMLEISLHRMSTPAMREEAKTVIAEVEEENKPKG